MIRSSISLGAAAVAAAASIMAQMGKICYGKFQDVERGVSSVQCPPVHFEDRKVIAMIDNGCKRAPYALAHLRIDTLVTPFGFCSCCSFPL